MEPMIIESGFCLVIALRGAATNQRELALMARLETDRVDEVQED